MQTATTYKPGDRVILKTNATARIIQTDPTRDRYKIAAVFAHNCGCNWDGTWIPAEDITRRGTSRPTYTYSNALQIILVDFPDGTEYRDRGQSAADLDHELRNATEQERADIFEQLHELANRIESE